MAQQIIRPPEEIQKPIAQPLPVRRLPGTNREIVVLLIVVSLLVLLFSGLLFANLPQAFHQPTPSNLSAQSASQVLDLPLIPAVSQGQDTLLQMVSGHYAIYEQGNKINLVAIDGGAAAPQVLDTPGYAYNRAVPPILLPSGQLLYSGNGLWLTNIFEGKPRQIASLSANQVITSMVLSQDHSTIAWSTEPIDGRGDINIYAGPLDSSTIIYQKSAADCPCFRVFSFLRGPGEQGNTTLLLSDDLGDHHAVQYGLWLFTMADLPIKEPQPLLSADVSQSPQGPLTLLPNSNTLLYSTYEGLVPAPTDGSAPSEIGALNYANSLALAPITGKRPGMGKAQIILPPQITVKSSADYRWAATPQISPDGHTLVYIIFSNDTEDPFDRHSSLYTVRMDGSGGQLHPGTPQLFSPSSARYVELGPWLNNRILTFYADNALFAVDMQSKAITTILQTDGYARIIAVL